MADQRPDDYVEYVQDFEICVGLPTISPFSDFPLVKFLSEQRQLYTNLFNIDVGQQSCYVKHQQTVKFLIVHPTKAVWVSFLQDILHLASNSNNSVMSSLVFVDQPMQLVNCAFRWGLQLDVQRHLWKLSEYFFETWHLLFIGTNCLPLRCKVQLDFWFKRRQIFEIVVSNETLDSTCPFELLVMMNNQNSIFSLTDIQLEHIAVSGCIFKGLNGIFRDISWTTTMSDSQNSGSIYGLLQAFGLISVALVKQGWKKEKNDAEGNITSKYEKEGDPDHNSEILSQSTHQTQLKQKMYSSQLLSFEFPQIVLRDFSSKKPIFFESNSQIFQLKLKNLYGFDTTFGLITLKSEENHRNYLSNSIFESSNVSIQ